MLIRIFLLISIYFVCSSHIDAQKRWQKKYEEAETSYQQYAQQQQDFERAAAFLEEMKKLTASKVEAEDEFYAKTVIYEVDFLMRQAKLLEGTKRLNSELEWLRTQIAQKTNLSLSHYAYFLTAGNIQLSLARAHKNGHYIPGLLKTPEWVRKANKPYETALVHLDQAIAFYEEFYQYQPKHPIITEQLALCFREKGEIQGRYLQKLDACIESFQKSINYKKDVESYRFLGVAYGIKAEHFKAIEAFEAALKLDERNLAILYNLEVAYRQLATNSPMEKLKEYTEKADSYHIKWKSIDPNYQAGQ